MNGTINNRKPKSRCPVIYRNGETFQEIGPDDDAISTFIRFAQCELSETWELYKKDGSLWSAFRPNPMKGED